MTAKKIIVTQHALERFLEHFPKLAKELDFESKWENSLADENKQFNMLLLYELLKRSEEQRAIQNDISYLMYITEKHGMEIDQLRLFSNHKVIFLCCDNKDQDNLVIKTIMPIDYYMGRYIPASNKVNFEDKQPDFKLGSIGTKRYLNQVAKLVEKKYNPLINQRLIKTYQDNIQDIKLIRKDKVTSQIRKENDIKITNTNDTKKENQIDSIQEHLSLLGIDYIMTDSNGMSICFLNQDYLGSDNLKTTIACLPQKILRSIMEMEVEQLKDFFNVFKPTEIDGWLQTNSIKADKNIYIRLLAQLNTPNNDTFVDIRSLKEILKITIPQNIKEEVGINNKDIVSINDKIKNLAIQEYSGMHGFMSFTRNRIIDIEPVTAKPFFTIQDNNTVSYQLMRNRLTHEIMICKLNDNKTKYTAIPTMEEYLNMINLFVKDFDNKNGNLDYIVGNKESLKQEIYSLVERELDKFTRFSQLIEQAKEQANELLLKQDKNNANQQIQTRKHTSGLHLAI